MRFVRVAYVKFFKDAFSKQLCQQLQIQCNLLRNKRLHQRADGMFTDNRKGDKLEVLKK